MKRLTIAFDLDNTLCTSIRNFHPEDIMKVKPRKEMIEALKELKRRGHRITIFTRRDACGKNARQLTIQWLKKYKIPYNELITDKPHYDILVDDRVISAFMHTVSANVIESNAYFIRRQNKKYRPKRKFNYKDLSKMLNAVKD